MERDFASFTERLAGISDLGEPLVNSKLVCLSNLADEELELFEKAWIKTELKRRCQLTSRLVELAEDNLELNFDGIFTICLRDASEIVRAQAVNGLALAENYSLVSPLFRLLREDDAGNVRVAAAIALGKFALLAELGKLPSNQAARVFSALLTVLEDEAELAEVKRRALEAIASFNSPRVTELLEQAYQSGDIRLKISALYAMGRNCDRLWLPILIKELDSEDAEMLFEAAAACGELGAREAVPHLINLVHDEDIEVQQAAIKALGEIGGAEAKQTLYSLLEDFRDPVRQAAEAALSELEFWEDPYLFEL